MPAATTASPTLTIGLLLLCFAVAVALAYLAAWPASLGAICCYPLAMAYMGYPIRLRATLPKFGHLDVAAEQRPAESDASLQERQPCSSAPRKTVAAQPGRPSRTPPADVFQLTLPE